MTWRLDLIDCRAFAPIETGKQAGWCSAFNRFGVDIGSAGNTSPVVGIRKVENRTNNQPLSAILLSKA